MINVKLNGEWDTLDTLNGYYCLNDAWLAAGKPEEFTPIEFFKGQGPHREGSVQLIGPKVWASQVKVYQYCSWMSPEFRADPMSNATGVRHK